MDLYLVLGLARDATLGDIRRAYRKLARKYHPDINPGDRIAADRFRRIADAYETLSDPERRQRYDVHGEAAVAGAVPGAGFEGFDFSVSVSEHAAPTFGDLFGDVLRQRAEGRGPVRGQDLHHDITLTFDEAMRGGSWPVTVTRLARCRSCRGRGTLEAAEQRCAACQGAGVLRAVRGHMVFTKPCAPCRGTGRRAEARCPACQGQQAERRTEALRVSVPAGLADGARIRVAGQGHCGLNGGEPGDLYLTLHVAPHARFRREGDDLCIEVPVAVHEAALGARLVRALGHATAHKVLDALEGGGEGPITLIRHTGGVSLWASPGRAQRAAAR